MSTWGEIRDWTVQRMGEYQAGIAEADGAASMVNATVYSRVTDAFRRMLLEAFLIKPTKVGRRTSFAYAADAESVTLPAAVKWRPVARVEQLLSGGTYEPLTQASEDQERRTRQDIGGSIPMDTDYAWRIEADDIWVFPEPTSALTLRVLYLPEHVAITVTDAAGVPSFIPAEHHMLIAMRAAISFLSETSRSVTLAGELARREADFTSWATKEPHAGPSYVREYE